MWGLSVVEAIDRVRFATTTAGEQRSIERLNEKVRFQQGFLFHVGLIDLVEKWKVNLDESSVQIPYLHATTIDNLSIHRLDGS